VTAVRKTFVSLQTHHLHLALTKYFRLLQSTLVSYQILVHLTKYAQFSFATHGSYQIL